MENKYRLSKEENLALAKNLVTKSIYSSARLEGINISLAESKAILDGIDVTRISKSSVALINDLKTAWDYTLDNIDTQINLELLCTINSLVLKSIEDFCVGTLRETEMEVSGKNILPPPNKDKVISDLEKILNNGTKTQQAIECFLYGCSNQLFSLGNKRTFMIVSNMILIQDGAGLMIVDDKDLIDFNLKLLYFYNTAKSQPLKDLLYNNCIIDK